MSAIQSDFANAYMTTRKLERDQKLIEIIFSIQLYIPGEFGNSNFLFRCVMLLPLPGRAPAFRCVVIESCSHGSHSANNSLRSNSDMLFLLCL
jgi:hypothetical protein